jgi:predicted DsbA family dithiol-disulfide isomerase
MHRPGPLVNLPDPFVRREQAADAAPHRLTLDVFFDFVCPWCLIGKRHLAAALERFAALRPGTEVELRWRPHVLLPHTPPAGLPYQSFYLARLGSAEAVAARRAQVREAGRAAGIDFAFERIAVLPNTAAAHALVSRAGRHDPAREAALIERLFCAYFLEGQDIGDAAVLARLARACGVDPERLAGASAHGTPRPGDGSAVAPGGVPTFVFNGALALSGAQPPELLLQALLRADVPAEGRA